MHKRYLLIPLFLAGSFVTYAQVSAVQNLNKNYQTGLELLDKEKFNATAEQFKIVEKQSNKPSTQSESNAELSLLKENAKFYAAVCALELTNSDAESLFQDFIRDYPLNPNTKLAYFYVGKTYFNQKNYTKALEWFEKTDPSSLSGKQRNEYQFKQGYSYFEQKNFEKAEPLFEQVKKEKGAYQESATYYFAYINYLNREYKTALANFEKLKGSPTYEASYPYYITSMYYLDEHYDDVIAYAIPAMAKTKQQFEPEMLSLVAASYFAQSDFKNAEKYFAAFYAKDKGESKNNLFIYQYGYTLFQNKKYTQAVTVLEKLNTDDIYLQNGMHTLGKTYLQLGDKAKAQGAFFRASRLTFDKGIQEEAWFNYAKLSYELEFHQQALDATQNFLKTFPNSKRLNEVKTLLAEVLLTTKNYQAAIDILEPMPNKTTEAQEAYQKVTYFRGLEFYNERAFPNALSMFLRSEKYPLDNEISALSAYWKGESMYELRKYAEAVKTFESFMQMPGADKTGIYNFANYALAYAAFEDEKYTKAANYFEKFLAGNDKDQKTVDDATIRLADSYFVNKNYGDALANYNTIIKRKTTSEDYALFQKGMIQGLQKDYDTKIATMQSLLKQFPNSNYADDAGFETAYTYFNKGDFDKSKSDLVDLVAKYPRSSYVPKALVTIGLVQYNQDQDDSALESFKKVIRDYPSADEAKQALESIKNIYIDKGDADGFITYAGTTPLGNYTNAEQDNIVFSAANNLYLKGDANAAFLAINAYFDKFPKPIHEKEGKFIRAESLVKLKRPDEAIADYEFILNDWTSDYTERSLLSISQLFLNQKKYNEAVVYLKRLETTTDYKSNYSYAINNLLKAYTALNMPDDMLKYAQLTKESEKASEEEKNSSGLFAGKAYLLKGDTTTAIKEFRYVVSVTKTIAAAEAKYNLALLEYTKGDYKTSQKTCFDLINNMPSYDYWVAKSFILLSDNYVALKDNLQAKSTLLSIIDNYGNKTDDIIATAKQKLEKLNQKK
ncbi:tetratricopeptide repeat protein [Pedobacter changchengzhani]|uniref:Tetratricopeptide repeat protein n=1 Tax=Pedobacter changchengzhani TaxID=2529274 RepID=A0A4R5MKQ3_9SPHI|nr:tetratricopeptide repeat protein [Pedobacter changchengzhani]TDG36307.1 tetratricopeptide repeat protein [Pedobacter changchengzhani]